MYKAKEWEARGRNLHSGTGLPWISMVVITELTEVEMITLQMCFHPYKPGETDVSLLRYFLANR